MPNIVVKAKQGEDVRCTILCAVKTAKKLGHIVEMRHNQWREKVYPGESYEEVLDKYRSWHIAMYGYDLSQEYLRPYRGFSCTQTFNEGEEK